VLATIAMAFTAWSYAEMSRVVPHAGSVFAYASEGLGGPAGFLAGWMAMLDYLLIPSVAYLFSGIALHALVPTVPAWIFTVAAFVATTALNLVGVRVAARVGTIVLTVEIAVFVVFVVMALVALTSTGPMRPVLSPLAGLGTFTPSVVVGAISVAVLSYLGFDAIAGFAEENAGDPREVGRAIVFCLLVAGVLFVTQTYLASLLSQVEPADLAAHPERQGTAFYDITRTALAPWLATVIAATKAVGPAFAAMTGQAAAARLLFGMARDGRLPRALASVDAVHGVPRASLLTAALLTLAVSVWAARRPDGLDVLVSIVDVGALGAFTLLHASVVGYFVGQRRGVVRAAHYVVPTLGAMVTLWVIAEASPLAQLVGGLWTAAALVILALRRGTPASKVVP
jgi:amino acid transporter